MDLRGILQSVTKKDYMRYQHYTTEKVNKEMLEEYLKSGKNKNCQITLISDMEHLSMKQMTYKPGTVCLFKNWSLKFFIHKKNRQTNDFSIVMDTGLEQTKVYEANYPENLRRIFMINGS
jgi:hypothetical protein